MARSILYSVKTYLFGTGGARVSLVLGWYHYLKAKGHRRFAHLLIRWLERSYGFYMASNAKIGLRVRFPHPVGIVIGDGVSIGNDCTIYQGVTLGGARLGDAQSDRYPSVGNGTVLFAGAVIVGDVEIGSNCVVGANAVVTKDVPSGYVAVGVPARCFPKKEVI